MKGEELSDAWRQRLLDAAKSGSTVKVWCSRNGYTLDQYYYWNRRLRDESAQLTSKPADAPKRGRPRVEHAADRKQDAAAPGQWLCVEPTADAAPSAPCQRAAVGPPDHLTVRICGAEIDVHSGFNANLLRSIVQALSVQPC